MTIGRTRAQHEAITTPVPAGHIWWETDQGQLLNGQIIYPYKIGDGLLPYLQLSYSGSSATPGSPCNPGAGSPVDEIIDIGAASCENFFDPNYGLTQTQRENCLPIRYIDCEGDLQQVPYPADNTLPIFDASACGGGGGCPVTLNFYDCNGNLLATLPDLDSCENQTINLIPTP